MSGFADRRSRLVALGVLSMGLGGFCALAAAMSLLGLVSEPALPGSGPLTVKPRAIVVEVFVFLSLAAVFIWLGIGSIRARRWVRPLMLTLAWAWLLGGALVWLFLALNLDDLLSRLTATIEIPPEVRLAVNLTILAFFAVLFLILPVIFIWGYQDRDVARTCEALDPSPSWTERCPTLVLGLSVGLGGCAYVALPAAMYAALPLFGWLVVGWPAAVLTLLGGAVCGYLAWSTFRLEPAGWWGTTLLLLLIGASSSATFLLVDTIEIGRAMGYPEELLEAMYGTLSPWWTVGPVVVLTAACIGYMVHIRKYFLNGASAGRTPARRGGEHE